MNLIWLFSLIVVASCSGNDTISEGHRVTHIVWFDIRIGNKSLGKIEIGLFGKVVPVAVRNFVNLANRPIGMGYKNSRFHYILSESYIMGGDYITGTGRSGRSSYDTPEFDDENFVIKHYGAGWISSGSRGPDNNTSRFNITFAPVPALDGVCVVFGKIIRGMRIIKIMSKTPVDAEKPLPDTDIIISDCGGGLADPPFFVSKTSATD